MKVLFWISLVFCASCSLGGQPYNPDSEALPGVTSGGSLQPLPSGAPTNSYATTTGGYVTLNSVIVSSVDTSEDLIGAAMMGTRTIVLLQRTSASYVIFWDVYELTTQGSFQLDCSIAPPLNSTGSFYGITYDGTALTVLNSSYSSGLALYQLDPDTCQTSPYKSLFSGEIFTPGTFAYFGGLFYVGYNDAVEMFNPVTHLITPFTYQSITISDATPQPSNVNFSIDTGGGTWNVDDDYNLWSGKTDGTWRGWMPLPIEPYEDLTDVQKIIAGSGSVTLLTFDPSAVNKVLRLYQFDTSHF